MEKVRQINRIFLITIIATIAASFVLGAIPAIRENELWSILISQAIYFIPSFLYLLKNGQNPKEALRIHKIRPATVIFLVLFAYLITPALNLLNAVSMLFSTNVISTSIAGIVSEYPLWTGVLGIAFIPCILEECVYRGVFFNEYRKCSQLSGIFISGLLFGLVHLNLNQFFYAFVMGIIFALLVEACDSLLASMIVHFTINATSVVLSYMVQGATVQEGELLGAIKILILPALVMGILAFAAMYVIAGLEGRREVLAGLFSSKKEKGESIVTLPLLLGMGICFILMIFTELVNRFMP